MLCSDEARWCRGSVEECDEGGREAGGFVPVRYYIICFQTKCLVAGNSVMKFRKSPWPRQGLQKIKKRPLITNDVSDFGRKCDR